MMGGYGMGLGGGLGMGFGWIIPIVVIGLIVWAVVAFARSNAAGGSGTGAAPDRSLAILKERYAKGELDADSVSTHAQGAGALVMALLATLWHGFMRLFGLNTCPTPPGLARAATPGQRATQARLERLLRRD